MRLPWVAPWGRVHAEALTGLGHEVLVVTSPEHHERAGVRAREVLGQAR